MTNCREKNVAVQDVVDNKVARRVDYVVREINRLRESAEQFFVEWAVR